MVFVYLKWDGARLVNIQVSTRVTELLTTYKVLCMTFLNYNFCSLYFYTDDNCSKWPLIAGENNL